MAYTLVKNKSVFGNLRIVGIDITADASTQTVESGLKNILFASTMYSSMGTANIHVATNSNASGVQSMGVLGISGCATGDRFFVTVFGT